MPKEGVAVEGCGCFCRDWWWQGFGRARSAKGGTGTGWRLGHPAAIEPTLPGTKIYKIISC